MEIVLFKDALDHFGVKELKKYDIDYEGREWLKRETIDLSELSTKKINELRNKLVELSSNRKVYGIKTAIKDIDNWLSLKKGDAEKIKARNSAQATQLLIEHIRPVPGHRVYKRERDTSGENIYLAYYVNRIRHYEKEVTSRGVRPAYVSVELLFQEFGGGRNDSIYVEDDDCRGKTASDILLADDFFIETDELRKKYLHDFERFKAESGVIGTQYCATGFGSTDVDGNDKDDEHWWRRSVQTVRLDHSGESAGWSWTFFMSQIKKTGMTSTRTLILCSGRKNLRGWMTMTTVILVTISVSLRTLGRRFQYIPWLRALI